MTQRSIIVACAVLAGVVGPAQGGDLALGQFLAGQCVQCHRADGRDRPGIPAITGWPADAFVVVLQSYKAKERPNVVMQSVAESLSDDDIAALAAYYASLKPAR